MSRSVSARVELATQRVEMSTLPSMAKRRVRERLGLGPRCLGRPGRARVGVLVRLVGSLGGALGWLVCSLCLLLATGFDVAFGGDGFAGVVGLCGAVTTTVEPVSTFGRAGLVVSAFLAGAFFGSLGGASVSPQRSAMRSA